MSSDLHHLTVTEASPLLEKGDLSPVELVEAVLARAELTEPDLSAYTVLLADDARAEAVSAAEEIARGNWKGPLHGIPLALKDLYQTAGIPTEGGSETMAGFVPEEDAEPVAKLKKAGAIIIGKTTTTEFGYGQRLPETRCAWDQGRYPGGSSVGSAVAVSVGSATAALGTDAGGSVRSPAAWNGIVGFKPTYGLISTRGVISPGPTVDHCGPLTRSVADARILLSALAGSPYDAEAEPSPVHDRQDSGGLSGVVLGVDRDFFFSDSVQADVANCAEAAIGRLAELGAEVVDISLGDPGQVMAAVMVLLAVDVSFAHQKWLRERPDRYHPGTKLLLELGELIPAMDYLRAVQFRNDFKHRVRDVFDKHGLNALVGPTSPMTAIPLDQLKVPAGKGGAKLADRIKHAAPFNLTGQPAISLPCGFGDDHLPVGLQFVGRPYGDLPLLSIASVYESATEWNKHRPPI